MAKGLPWGLLRQREDPRRASFLELFFDLAFIFALTRLSRELQLDLSLHGAFRVSLLLAAIWWVWFVTAFSSDWFDPRTPLITTLLLWAMFGGLLMAAAVPTAFSGHALVFAGAYVAIHLGRAALLIPALRGHPLQLRTVRVAIWFALSGILWLAGAFVAPAREVLWAVALVMDYSLASLGWPTPRLGRSTWSERQVVGEHLSERYQQIFIIALGELILMAGITYSEAGFDQERTLAFALTFVTAVSICRLYLAPAGVQLGSAIEEAGPPGNRLAFLAGYLHLVMIAGTVTIAVGAELMIAEPTSSDPDRQAVIAAGPVLFLTGRILLSALIHHRLSWPRVIGLIVFIIGGLVGGQLPLVGAGVITTWLLIVIALADVVADRTIRRRGPART
ncbi:low temperature requirement protein A [Micromonospora sp. IBHARD004]|uniref:low temperature requirement protein A n=1 Tax=Micromonospora sp. IBHARD004 TaxID=3457764 RepID=UPI004058A6C8